MATIAKDIMRVVGSLTDSPPIVPDWLPEAASQTYVRGELLYVNPLTGYLTEADANTLLYAMAHHNASGTTGDTKDHIVVMLHPTTLFEANLLTGSGSDLVCAQSHIGRVMGLYFDTVNNRIVLDGSVTGGSGAKVFTHKVARGSAIGDTNARVVFSFMAKAIQYLTTS